MLQYILFFLTFIGVLGFIISARRVSRLDNGEFGWMFVFFFIALASMIALICT